MHVDYHVCNLVNKKDHQDINVVELEQRTHLVTSFLLLLNAYSVASTFSCLFFVICLEICTGSIKSSTR